MEYKRQVGKLIKILSISFEKEFTKIVSSFGLTASQSMVLFYLYKNKNIDVNPVDLEKFFEFSHVTILGILKRLEEKEFITIEKSLKDQRYRIVKITEKGLDTESEIKKSLKTVAERMNKGISKEEQDIFASTAIKMIENLRRKSDD